MSPHRHLPSEDQGASVLEVFVTPGCEACEHARMLAQRAAQEFHDLEVAVVDLDETPEGLPPQVFAVPTFLLNGTVVSLGNPSWERLSALLTTGGLA
jgi:thiol-disulfide isomerase/thioredoxin